MSKATFVNIYSHQSDSLTWSLTSMWNGIEACKPRCRYCVLFEPEYNSGATLVHSKHTVFTVIIQDAIMAKINCEVNRITCQKYSITKYPTLKVFRFGEVC
ncbi:Protein disulfide-isomerase A3 [Thelohanellus kitauei]|uniref:Protein disulfide-isomerase A3 n=1 Tax=Thelohanellus kitauei TaxID=669202 RepID=A0A0C2IV91_THEKT|nr:Protein disulfide-isomerase A3 [Thelohanellus kitauei]